MEGWLAQAESAMTEDPTIPERQERALQVLRNRKQLREAFLINCWHINDHESAGMWKLYAQVDNGIAVQSTVQRLKDSLQCTEEVLIGAVDYLDYETSAFPSPNIFHACMTKRKSFEHERELRAVIWDQERFKGISGTYPIPEDKDNSGTLASVNLDLLVEEIHILPGAPAEFRASIESLCEKYGLQKEVKQSSLDGDPLY